MGENVMHGQPMDLGNPKDIDMVLLFSRLGQKKICYTRMKTYRNHLKVEDLRSCSLQTFDSGVASMFDMPFTDASKVSVNYVEILKDIFKLDYGSVHTPMIIFRCKWIK
jgi:hypothetical protein